MKRVVHFLCVCLGSMVCCARADAAAEAPRPEHPRPDLFRANWMTLNGEWQFEIDNAADGESRGLTYGKDLNSKIIVPFCPESKLSGLGLGNTQKFKDVWYRRMIELPSAMKGKRVRIHFGGVDYKTWVYINGQLAGTHIGESSAFSFEITRLLTDGSNEVVVKVLDDMSSRLQPSGKQEQYTRTTGIWQPVWLEAVGSSFVEHISIVPDPDNARVLITATINGSDKDLKLTAEAFADGKPVGSETAVGPWQNRLVLNLKEKRLWAPGSPFLYDLKLTLYSGKEKLDELASYFGLCKVTIDGRRILINGKPVFQRLILDQGFYSEGLWTAPTDEALKKDIEMSMACGYNGARLHQKVFEPRFLYWADKLGYMVWGESPNWGYDFKPEGYAAFVNEWTEVLLRDRNHPSVVGWCAFNETFDGAAELQQMVWNVTKAVDPTRPALEASGWAHTMRHPEVTDRHDYDNGNPARLRARWLRNLSVPSETLALPSRYGSLKASRHDRGMIPFMLSEIGGVGWEGWGHGPIPKTLDEFYFRYEGNIQAMLDNPHLFGFCYTQLYDIETEKNGLYYYDRKPKFDVKRIHDVTSRAAAYERDEPEAGKPAAKAVEPKWRVLIGAVQDGDRSTPYQYATEKPADDWTKAGFDDHSWKTGLAPFANGGRARTPWTTPDIYLRKTFEFDGGDFKNGCVVIRHGDNTEIYLNGQMILDPSRGARDFYIVTAELKKVLKKGANTIAVHSHEGGCGQHLDLALLVE